MKTMNRVTQRKIQKRLRRDVLSSLFEPKFMSGVIIGIFISILTIYPAYASATSTYEEKINVVENRIQTYSEKNAVLEFQLYSTITELTETKEHLDTATINILEYLNEIDRLEEEQAKLEEEMRIGNMYASSYVEDSIPVDSSYYPIIEKYEYMLDDVRDDSTLTIDDIAYIDTIAKELNVNPHIMMGIYEHESEFKPQAKNSSSSATGLGQIISSTGKAVHTKFIGSTESYDHSIQYNAKTNILYTFELMDYNLENYSTKGAIMYYNGGSNMEGYYNSIISYLSNNGINITTENYV